MYYVYVIENMINKKIYVGYTNNYIKRWSSHKHNHKFKQNILYNSMRKHGFDNFEMILVSAFENKIDAHNLERYLISLGTDYNLAPGGEDGFVVLNRKE